MCRPGLPATAALSVSMVAVYATPGTGDYVAITAMLAIVTGVLGVVAELE